VFTGIQIKKTDFKLMQYNEKHIFLNLGGA